MATHPHDTSPPACAPEARAGRVRFRDAAILARRGLYGEAQGLLDEALHAGGCTEREALDLRARMCAQQGLLLEAEAHWTRAAELAGDPRAYAPQLARLRGQVRASGAGAARVIAGLALLAALAGWVWQCGGSNVRGRGAAAAAPTLPSVAPVELMVPPDQASKLHREQAAMSERLVALLGQVQAGVASLAGVEMERAAAAGDQARLLARLEQAAAELNELARTQTEQATQALHALTERVAGWTVALEAHEACAARRAEAAQAQPPTASDAPPRPSDESALRIAALEFEVRRLAQAIESLAARAGVPTQVAPPASVGGATVAPSTTPAAAPAEPPTRGPGSRPCAPRYWPR